MSCLVFISIAWYIMWHEINVQVIFAEWISEQTLLSSGLLVQISSVTLELDKMHPFSRLNLIQLSYYYVQEKRERDGQRS
jgi:hypothetical protein